MKTNKILKFMSYSSYFFAVVSFVVLAFAVFYFNIDAASSNGIMAVVEDDKTANAEAIQKGMAYMGAGFACVGLFGAGIGQGYAAGKASEAVGRNPEAEPQIRNMLLIGAAIAESSALYSLVISIILIFVA